jgi:exportin-2 (importin alpha re-exporter)
MYLFSTNFFLLQIGFRAADDFNIEGDVFIEIEDTPGYQAAYSQLNFAQPKKRILLPKCRTHAGI